MLAHRPADLLKEEIDAILSLLTESAGLKSIVQTAVFPASDSVEAKNRAKNIKTSSNLWALLPLQVCEAICGEYGPAVPAAASLQFLRAAAEVFDDLEDADSSESLSAKYGNAIAINVASTLLILAERALPRLKLRNIDDHTIVRVMEVINSCYLNAAAGQHLDLSLSPDTLSEDTYFKIAYLKSASTLECACIVGALLAGAASEMIAKFAKFGYNIGMMAQIANDLQGISGSVDIRQRKVTLPVIYALSQTKGEVGHRLDMFYSKHTEYQFDPAEIRDLLFQCGAVYYTTLKMEVFKQTALDILQVIENLGADIQWLKTILE